jgi:hypothetical protein
MWLLVYALPLMLFLYGLKCLLTMHGNLPVGNRSGMHRFNFITVGGATALLTGLGYISLSLFVSLCTGDPPPETRRWYWRVLRGVARWGSVAGMFWFWQRACQLIHVGGPWPRLESPGDFFLLGLVAMCFGMVAALCFLWAMFQREAVKRNLFENGCRAVHVWWRPAAYWMPWLFDVTAFRVIYRDFGGSLHKAYCCVYRSFGESPNWGSRRVRWLRDVALPKSASTDSWVFVDSLPMRPGLKPGVPSAEANPLLLDNLNEGEDAA